MSVQVGVVGYGLAGQVFHAPLIAAAAGLELAAIVSSRPEAVRADFPAVRVLPDFEALLADPAVELVVVATPNIYHLPMARAALEAGKHVVVDKPFTNTADEADLLIDLAAARQLVLSPFQNRRWDSDFRTIQAALAAGELGEIITYEGRYDRYAPRVRNRWREQDLPGSGTWYDLGAHLVDQALVLFGHPETVTADLQIQRPGGAAVDYFHVVLGCGRRRVILHGGCLAAEHGLRYLIHGRQGSLIKRGLDPQEDQLKGGLRPGDPGFGVEDEADRAELVRRSEAGVERRLLESAAGRYVDYYEGLARSIVEGGPPPVSAVEGRNVIAVIEAGVESAQEGRTISLQGRLR